MTESKICTILDTRIDTLSLNDVLKQVYHWVDSKQPHQITTVNTEFIMEARGNKAFKETLHASDLALADGAGVLLAAKLLNQPIPPKISGVDFVHFLAKEAVEQGFSIFLLGGWNGIAGRVADILKNRHPGLKIVGTYEGTPLEKDLTQRIKKANPDILLVAWGAPKQDVWINEHKEELGVPVMMGVGGTFDFIAGKQKRAPKWMRDFGLEWLWRLVREPWRWKRQLALPQMFLLIFWQHLSWLRR